ncbi:hypothetical protein [Tsukamurella paurometabola]|uniref:Uncharacterized protein n=1 Tax=Tsukamurella paurometabola TaxID=2061 RepID=A0ABS5NEQ6_TSUPA|nr:hypothetical protein [Tsukamurella paurometabola]MBS4102750.1 hypothetical protein [Tsukamurella paurometabola]
MNLSPDAMVHAAAARLGVQLNDSAVAEVLTPTTSEATAAYLALVESHYAGPRGSRRIPRRDPAVKALEAAVAGLDRGHLPAQASMAARWCAATMPSDPPVLPDEIIGRTMDFLALLAHVSVTGQFPRPRRFADLGAIEMGGVLNPVSPAGRELHENSDEVLVAAYQALVQAVVVDGWLRTQPSPVKHAVQQRLATLGVRPDAARGLVNREVHELVKAEEPPRWCTEIFIAKVIVLMDEPQ